MHKFYRSEKMACRFFTIGAGGTDRWASSHCDTTTMGTVWDCRLRETKPPAQIPFCRSFWIYVSLEERPCCTVRTWECALCAVVNFHSAPTTWMLAIFLWTAAQICSPVCSTCLLPYQSSEPLPIFWAGVCLGLSPLTPWRASTTSQAGDISANGIVAPGSGTYVAWVSTDNPGRNFKLGLFWEHKLINWQPHHNLLFCIHKQDPRTLLLSAIH